MNTTQKIVIAAGIIGILFIIGILAYILTSMSLPGLSTGGVVAVVPLKGDIAGECSSYGGCMDPEKFKEMMEIAENDNTVKAIIIKVDSGGGEVVASRDLMKIVKNAKKQKPVIAYVNDIGASGAYYAASASDKIVANEFAFVGSIGVKSEIVHYKGLLDKLGINITVVMKPDNKDFGSPYRENLTDDETKLVEDIIKKIYDAFVSDVAENRNLSKERVKEISEGQSIYLGKDAKENGLVDYVGDMDDAIDIAAKDAGIEGDVVVRYIDTGQESIFDRMAMKVGYGFAKGLVEIEGSQQKIVAR
ncbi:Signal peptide peptidase SppA, 36K type [groundwater metagenome]|uniref:Signal peptide peptidase SppA, 36K type n=1 Tax=groundwater metagenome TaxID=717931 RepID=A0A098ECU4_9ZZZZ